MKTADIRSKMDDFLAKLGFARGARLWQPGRLVLVIGGEFHEFRMPSGMSQKALTFEMGWIACLAKLNHTEPPKARKANGHDNQLPALMPA